MPIFLFLDNATPSYIDGVCLGNKILLTDGSTVGLRSDYNGILFLDSILQSPVSNPNDIVEIELTLSEVYLHFTLFFKHY